MPSLRRDPALALWPRAASRITRLFGQEGTMRLQRRRFLHLATAAAALSAMPHSPCAQSSYPDRPVRMVVPYAPGGPTDIVTRLIAQRLSDRLGKQFFVENIGGGGGN